MNKKAVAKNLKLLLGVGILGFILLSQDNAAQIAGLFRKIEPPFILALICISLGTTLTNTTKWSLFLRGAVEERIPFWRLFVVYMVGKFFNNFAPSMMGGDVARIYLLGKNIGSHSRSAATVFMERAMGMVGLVFIAVFAAAINPSLLQYPFVSIPIALAALACLAAIGAYFQPRMLELIRRLCELAPFINRFSGILHKLIDAVFYYRSHPLLLVQTLLLSMQFHVIACLNVYTACRAIHFAPNFLDVMVITPVVLLLTAIPVSPRGIGWWEWCFGVFFAQAGGSMAEGTAVALLLRIISLLFSLVGGLFFILDGRFGLQLLPPAAPARAPAEV